MFKKSKEKNKIENNSKAYLVPELKFDISKMPKNYKIGRFDNKNNKIVVKNNSNNLSPNLQDDSIKHQKNKRLGFIFLIIGIFLVASLVYLIFSYAKSPNFSLKNIFSFGSPSENSVQQNLGGKGIVDIIKDDIVKNEEIIINTSTEEIIETDPLEEKPLDENSLTGEVATTTPEIVENFIFLDSDGDGLSDAEEDFLGTDKLKYDSDDDGYSDLQELQNLYNPIGEGSLIKNISIAEYKSSFFKYSVLYPFSWEINALNDDSSVIFSINKNSFVQILVEENVDKQNIKTWYAKRFFELVDEKDLIKSKNWQGIYGPDKTAFYLSDNKMENIYTILYNTSAGREKEFANIFNMIIKSFSLN